MSAGCLCPQSRPVARASMSGQRQASPMLSSATGAYGCMPPLRSDERRGRTVVGLAVELMGLELTTPCLHSGLTAIFFRVVSHEELTNVTFSL